MAKKHSPGFLKLANEARANVKETDIERVHARLSNSGFLLIDVREESEWQAGHLPNATHLGKGIIERDIEKRVPDPKTPLVLYCGGGYRSALAADALQRMGYANVESMAGGFSAWRDAGFEIETDGGDK